jgi:hypothetical protein
MTHPRPELLPKGATLITWALTPEVYEKGHQHREWRQWGEGPWDGEPDRIEWRKPGSPLPRMAIRNHFGAWCGYVGVPEGHPLFGKGWDAPECEAIAVHGGLTYGNACAGNVCHVPQPGEPDHVWWLGFDCAHCFDHAPGLGVRFEGDTYRDVAYVIAETERLAAGCER